MVEEVAPEVSPDKVPEPEADKAVEGDKAEGEVEKTEEEIAAEAEAAAAKLKEEEKKKKTPPKPIEKLVSQEDFDKYRNGL